MDELDLFRDLGGAPVAPSDEVRRRASASLVAAIQRERASSARSAPRFARRRYGVLAFAAALVVTSATALFFLAPWASSPGFLERAQAALTPSAGTILHYRWRETRTSTQFSCTVTERPSEIWIDWKYPRQYRALLGNWRPESDEPRKQICSRGRPAEIGGDLTERPTLMFFPPDWVSYAPRQYRTPYDPAGDLREAISAGRARHDGQTKLGGRTVERIRIDPPPDCPAPDEVGISPFLNVPSCSEPSYAYVDPDSYDLVQTESLRAATSPIRPYKVVNRYLTFEYLPRTAANLARTDIVAQHPNAGGPYHPKKRDGG